MVSVNTGLAPKPGDLPGRDEWLDDAARGFSAEECARLAQAYDCAVAELGGAQLPSGESALGHALGVASLLAHMRMDVETVAAGLVAGVLEADPEAGPRVAQTLGEGVAALAEGVARMGQVEALGHGAGGRTAGESAAQAEALRKMLLAMVQDLRVVVIRLADRTQNLRELARADEELRRPAAQAARDLYAPLANRLGVWQIKWELEDLSFRFTDPETYKRIARMLDERRMDRERYIAQVISHLEEELAKAGIKAQVSGRAKHIFSIFKKMQRKQAGLEELYDVRAVRILVDDLKSCYTALGVVHGLWTPIPREFDDYIAKPKANNYRSLHTAVVGPDGRALEVQIRSHEMHGHAELGVAAHWRYKEGAGKDAAYDQKIAWLRQILAWRDELADAGDFVRQFRTELLQDQVYVFTPEGRVIELPAGSSPVDFAYHVHTALGHRCRGAKVDGRIVPLNYVLKSAQVVEILAAKEGGPSRDWLNPALGYLQSSRGRAKVRQWFKNTDHAGLIAQGRALVEKEAHRLGMSEVNLEHLAERMRFPKAEELFLAAGRGELTLRQVQMALQAELPPPSAEAPVFVPVARPAQQASGGGVLVEGVDNLMTSFARCCKPVPDDPIVGFVTRGRGISIHRRDCRDLRRLAGEESERLITADWGRADGQVYQTELEVRANDRPGLLRDISDILAKEKVNVTSVNTLSRGHLASMRFGMQVTGTAALARVKALLREIPGVLGIRRC